MELLTRILNLVKPYWFRMSIAIVLMAIVGSLSGLTAYLVKPVMDGIFVKKNVMMLKILPLIVLAVFLVRSLCDWGQRYQMRYVGLKIISDLRQKLYDHIQNMSLSFIERSSTGVLMSRITNDVNLLQGAVSAAITSFLKDSFTMIGLVFVVFYQDWRLASLAILILPGAYLLIDKLGKKMRRYSKKCQQAMGDISSIVQELLRGIRVVKAFNSEEYELKKFDRENERIFKYNMRISVVQGLSSPLMELLGAFGIATIIGYGGYQVIQGQSTPGTFFSFLAALFMLYKPMKRLSKVNNLIQNGLAAANRIYEILDTEPDITNRTGAVELKDVKKGIEFKDVSFSYGEGLVLRDINISIPAGDVVALVGVSGGGKTTLASLIPRFYDLQEGEILIDGVDLRNFTVDSLRSRIALVNQDPFLFNDTIWNNIAYGNFNKTEEDIISAAKAAYAYDFIVELPAGFDTVVGDRGVSLSGGQKQRICIARAFLKDAPILILDEATSSLDNESEKEVQKSLFNLMKGRTTIIIAHRLSTVINASKIFVISSGKIIEAGSHDQLLKAGGEYSRLYKMQFLNVREEIIDR
ncbi:MAG: lipid A export permease/ATP-binding protein MsbA [Deltaproteobacteria bacterium]|nr:MAG: lipid A export permease/ATP-binding protein MsbA [Deltaproteobacteria bacterium]RLB07090.1 MAG: lipid A export permease/ATP-binding protein MsbA [Deltaproteobacteria bacterium]